MGGKSEHCGFEGDGAEPCDLGGDGAEVLRQRLMELNLVLTRRPAELNFVVA